MKGWGPVRMLCAALGLAALALAWGGPLGALAGVLFSAHMAMHLLVVAVAAPLLAIALAPALRAVRGVGAVLLSPMVASALDLAVVWGFHAPGLHALARGSLAWGVIEQGLFLAAGLSVWLAALRPDDRAAGQGLAEGQGAAAGAGILGLLFTSVHMTLLGALLALANRPIYGHALGEAAHGGGLRQDAALASLGITSLDDQHLGGVLMLAVGGSVYLIGGLALVARLVMQAQPGEAPSPALASAHAALSRSR